MFAQVKWKHNGNMEEDDKNIMCQRDNNVRTKEVEDTLVYVINLALWVFCTRTMAKTIRQPEVEEHKKKKKLNKRKRFVRILCCSRNS